MSPKPSRESRQRGKSAPREKLDQAPVGVEKGDVEKKPESAKASKLKAGGPPRTPSGRKENAGEDAVTPAKVKSASKAEGAPKSAKALSFSSKERIKTLPAVQAMYKVVNKCTGSLGGNGAGGVSQSIQTNAFSIRLHPPPPLPHHP